MQAHKPYEYWLQKNKYYHHYLARLYRFSVPEGKRVLQVGCKTGFLLDAVKPAYGIGVDTDSACIAQARMLYGQHHFFEGTVSQVPVGQIFDYIILSSEIMEVEDIQTFFESLKAYTHRSTRIIVDMYSYVWEPILWIAQKCGLRRTTPLKNWIGAADLRAILYLAGFDVVTHDRFILIPVYIPVISLLINTCIAPLPLINTFCLLNWMVIRPVTMHVKECSVSVIVTCKNERGNIQAAVDRTPQLGTGTELIFVEGGSTDGTKEEIERVMALYPGKKISLYKQPGKGKGDAVRIGFAKASGDILMILDGDLTVPPEDLPKFYQALVSGKGDFINGSRLVYGMESEAMRFMNLIANYCFGVGFSWLLGQRIKDTLCGTKVLFKKDYENIVQGRTFFGEFDPFGDFDLLFGAAKQNLKIVDMPVHYKNRTYGSTNIRRWYHGVLLAKMWLVALKKFKIR